MTKQKLILVGGPTASGKSAFAMEIARREHSIIINADAMQIYAGLPILTAQPSTEDKKAIPHKLYETVDPSERFSVGKWLPLVRDEIRHCAASGHTPILVGGTGLYFKALTEGLSDIPPIPDEVREKAHELYAQGAENFRAELAKLDPEGAARLNDKQRLIRAYEVALHTGKPLSHWHAQSKSGLSDFTIQTHLLMPPREELYDACDKRFELMIKQGAIDEVQALLARNLAPNLPAMKILGVREITAYLRGEMSLAEATAKAQQTTRNYAKRQMTWFRNQWKKATPLPPVP